MSLMAGKYFRVFWAEWKKIKEYKLDFFLALVRIPIHVLLLLLVWTTVFEKTESTALAGMTFPAFAMYIVLARLMSHCQRPWELYEFMLDYIRTGKIALYLARPLYFSIFFFSRAIAASVFQLIVVLVVVIAGSILRLLGMNFFFPHSSYFLLFVLSFFLAIVLGVCIYYCISLAMLWVGDVWSVWHIWDGVQVLFSGEVIPLTISAGFYTIASFLPFKHLVFTPVFIYLEKFSIGEALAQIGIQCAWIMFFAVLAHIILLRGLKKLDVQGG